MDTTQQPEALAELRERLRSFEADHTPDGWPAVRMRDITALLDELDNMVSGLVRPPTTSPQADSVLEDAARYRFLRDGEWRDTDLEPFIRLQLNTLWDAKIDAARAAQEGGK